MTHTRLQLSSRHAAVLFLGVLFAAVLISGCTPGGGSWARRALESADMLSTPDLLAEAGKAWNAHEYVASELYYSKALERQDLRAGDKTIVVSRLGISAFKSEHFRQARASLEQWANLDIKAVSLWSWQEAYLGTMAALGKDSRLKNHMKWALGQKGLPWQTRMNMALWYSDHSMATQDWESALSVLKNFYSQSPGSSARSTFEQSYEQRLGEYSDGELSALSRYVSPNNLYSFPYALVAFQRSLREVGDKSKWSAVWRSMHTIAANADLADREPLVKVLEEYEARYGLPRVGLALALPMTGPYGKVGAKILRGIGVGQWRLATRSVDVDIRVINTASPGWVDRLNALPSHFTLVGGPLRVDAFKELLSSPAGNQILRQRAFFTFLPDLGNEVEGRDAWRFFTSREDEVKSLVRMAVERLGIHDLAVFYPQEKFGMAMARSFQEAATPLGATIKKVESYPSGKPTSWNGQVAKLLDVPADFSDHKDVPLPMPEFGAVFIPDGWRQAQSLLPNFFFYEGEQLVFLGPGLWSRALDRGREVDAHYYKLAVCPGAWWAGSDGAMALQDALAEEGLGRADFWVALGFDFVRFVGRMGVLPTGWDAGDVNARIMNAQNIDFSIAALSWTGDGVASQDLFMFSPLRRGKAIANVDTLRSRMENATNRRIRRGEAYKKRIEEEKAN